MIVGILTLCIGYPSMRLSVAHRYTDSAFDVTDYNLFFLHDVVGTHYYFSNIFYRFVVLCGKLYFLTFFFNLFVNNLLLLKSPCRVVLLASSPVLCNNVMIYLLCSLSAPCVHPFPGSLLEEA